MKSQKIIDFVELQAKAKPVVFEKYENMYKALKDKKIKAIIGDAPILSYYVSDHSEFKIVGDIFEKENYGILFPEGSKLKEKIDRAIIQIHESGKYQEIWNKYFGQ